MTSADKPKSLLRVLLIVFVSGFALGIALILLDPWLLSGEATELLDVISGGLIYGAMLATTGVLTVLILLVLSKVLRR